MNIGINRKAIFLIKRKKKSYRKYAQMSGDKEGRWWKIDLQREKDRRLMDRKKERQTDSKIDSIQMVRKISRLKKTESYIRRWNTA